MTSDDRNEWLLVFSQSESALVDAAGWDAHAARFFRTRLTLVQPRDGAVQIAPEGEPGGVRLVRSRVRADEDLALAEAADRAGAGLALLARRCSRVWLVSRETVEDLLALRLAAIVASVVLGPILDARVPELLGVKSARARFERGQAPRPT